MKHFNPMYLAANRTKAVTFSEVLRMAMLLTMISCGARDADGASEEIRVLDAGSRAEPCRPPNLVPHQGQFREYGEYPCQVVAIATSFVLTPSHDGSRPDPDPRTNSNVVRDSRGRFFTTSTRGEPIEVWDSLGKHISTIGRRGAGPGEFADWPLSLFLDVGDTLHVLDGAGRWQIFDSTFKFVRSFKAAPAFNSVALISGGPVAFANAKSWGVPHAMLAFMTREGLPVGSTEKTVTTNVEGRRISAAPDGTVWITPLQGDTTGYVLENWTTNGILARTIRRDVPWLPSGGYSDEPRLPSFRMLHVDEEGLIWVAIGVKDPRWYPSNSGAPSAERDSATTTLYDLRLEVIDPEKGVVLASVRYDAASKTSLPPIYPVGRGTRLFWGTSSDSLGQTTLRTYRLTLAEPQR